VEHISFVLYLTSLITGAVSIGISVLIYSQYKKKVVMLYILFITALSFILIELCAYVYAGIAGVENSSTVQAVANTFDIIGVNLIILVCPFFFHHLLGVPVRKAGKIIFISVACITLSLAIGRHFFLEQVEFLTRIIGVLLLFGTMSYGLLLILFHLRTIGNSLLKKALAVFLVTNIAFAPILIIEILRPNIPFLADFPYFEIFSLPFYFFCINALSIVFAIRYFNQPPYMRNSELTDHFTKTFHITAREGEVVMQVIQGLSYSQIGEKLFISHRTVDNHIRNIYRKTGVKNRLQLVSLIQSNQQS
jgi:DNA-binding CsgD family transcriptional regulator